MKYYIESLENLIDEFEKLPGIGRKTAQRLAFFLISQDESYAQSFSSAMISAKNNIRQCNICNALTDKKTCDVCLDSTRDKSMICVVETSKDIIAFEKTGEYNGLYHVLNGLISPINGVDVDSLTINHLLSRVQNKQVQEVIMATNPTIEGETTSMYISKLLKKLNVKVSRLAYGVPVGSNLEFADEITLFRALQGRNTI